MHTEKYNPLGNRHKKIPPKANIKQDEVLDKDTPRNNIRKWEGSSTRTRKTKTTENLLNRKNRNRSQMINKRWQKKEIIKENELTFSQCLP